MSFVRKSKFRHVFGELAKREFMYEGIKGTGTTLDTNMIKVNNKYISYIWEGSGGGAICVFPSTQVGRHPTSMPLIRGHTRPVTDMDFCPHDPDTIATTCEDCTVRVWKIPESGMPADGIEEPVAAFTGHGRKSTEVIWNPCASGILASAGADATIKVWDLNSKERVFSIDGQHGDAIQSFQWNQAGNMIGTQCRDKKIRLFDVRSNQKVLEIQSHAGVKTARFLFNNKRNWLMSTGFGQGSNRQVLIWDERNTTKPIVSNVIDQASGIMMPFFDEATQILFIGSKGEANIRYYELTEDPPHFFYITTFPEGTPTRGLTALPKQYVHSEHCEIMKFFRITAKDSIEPISFVVPRRSEMFQADIYPPVVDTTTPSMTGEEWIKGENKPPRYYVFTADGKGEHCSADEVPASATPSPSPVQSPQPAGFVPASSSSTPSIPDGHVPKTQLDAANAKIAELEKQLAEIKAKAEGGNGSAKIEQLEKALKEKDEHIADTKAKIEELQKDIVTKDEAIAELKKQLEEKKAEL
ncbi:coronin [Monocercomonoides exilis]|uniref:coronin n=1 Tax=Monocercomonoides exilis TaxID=2049356 RepID=UPI00355A7A5D|nr:coronin [Monocercomonoides exilis]|eukprot:MONOS_14852.1-p1 / transcript=MONOS_14852.1 / gene=MONOS_14852 / organism=Monocercomonoides_exilis_PA203 / gene_product=coronin / transcript_product=coronin / location=Mono_scaffold01086:14264-15935(-) / protein_length=526 / sequence_SO=supercontig / SO=protein_coding / is_pseudo=false